MERRREPIRDSGREGVCCTGPMADLIDVAEWRRWLCSRRGRERWRAWSDDRPALRGWTIDELAEPRWSPRVDRLQHDLVALAQTGEGPAGLTLLVQLRPGLLRLAARQGAVAGLARNEACDEVRSAFVETLYRHRLDRRPCRIAANLVLDTRQRLGREDRWRDRLVPLSPPLLELAGPSPGRDGPGQGDPGPAIETRSTLRRAVDRLPGTEASRRLTAEAAWRAWFLEEPRASIAADLGLAPAAVTARLHRLRRAVRRELDEPMAGAA